MDKREYWRSWYRRLKENAERYREYASKRKQYQKKYREKKKLLEKSGAIKGVVKMEEKKYKQESIPKAQQVYQEVQLDDWQKQMLINDIAWTRYALSRGVCVVNEEIFNEKLKLAHQLGLDSAITNKLRSILLSNDW